jgi:undecaprenyl-phosphate 4-deoxy-4-formamido-L-arabinose transferase
VVVPVYRNRDTLAELLERLDRVLEAERREYVFVVDGSPDDSLERLLDEQRRHPHLVVLELARNCGQHAALCAGFAAVRARVVLVIDADLQQRPEDLPRFLERWRAGHDFVSGWRTSRRDAPWRQLGSGGMNWLVRTVTGVHLHDWGCPLAAIDRSILERIPESGEQRRFLKPLVAKLSRHPTEVEIEGLEREGQSSYGLITLLGLSLDFVVSFSNRPFQRLAGLGLVLTLAGFLGGLGYLVLRLASAVEPSPRIQALMVIALLLGLQLLILGALGEFTHRIYRLVQGLPLYEVRARHEAGAAAPGAP